MRVFRKTWALILAFLRWLFAYDQCGACDKWRPRRGMEWFEFVDERGERVVGVCFVVCERCMQGRTHEAMAAELNEMYSKQSPVNP